MADLILQSRKILILLKSFVPKSRDHKAGRECGFH